MTTAELTDSLSVNYVGSAAADGISWHEDRLPTWLNRWWRMERPAIVANPTGPATGVTSYGIKLEGSTSQGAGTEEGLYIGSGWDIGVDIASGGLQLADGNDPVTPAANT